MSVVLGLSGCATVQSENLGTPVDDRGQALGGPSTNEGLVVSGEEMRDLSSPLFGALQITIENHSARWKHLQSVRLRFGETALDQAVLVPSAGELDAWLEATLIRNEIRRTNTSNALTAVTAGALLGSAIAGRHTPVGSASGLVALAGVGALIVNGAAEGAERRESGQIFPANHLLAGPISVPPGLFAKRWIVFYTPEPRVTGCLRLIQISYQLDDGQTEHVRVLFRGESPNSEWQASVCPGRGTGAHM